MATGSYEGSATRLMYSSMGLAGKAVGATVRLSAMFTEKGVRDWADVGAAVAAVATSVISSFTSEEGRRFNWLPHAWAIYGLLDLAKGFGMASLTQTTRYLLNFNHWDTVLQLGANSLPKEEVIPFLVNFGLMAIGAVGLSEATWRMGGAAYRQFRQSREQRAAYDLVVGQAIEARAIKIRADREAERLKRNEARAELELKRKNVITYHEQLKLEVQGAKDNDSLAKERSRVLGEQFPGDNGVITMGNEEVRNVNSAYNELRKETGIGGVTPRQESNLEIMQRNIKKNAQRN